MQTVISLSSKGPTTVGDKSSARTWDIVAAMSEGRRLNSPNDATADEKGRIATIEFSINNPLYLEVLHAGVEVQSTLVFLAVKSRLFCRLTLFQGLGGMPISHGNVTLFR